MPVRSICRTVSIPTLAHQGALPFNRRCASHVPLGFLAPVRVSQNPMNLERNPSHGRTPSLFGFELGGAVGGLLGELVGRELAGNLFINLDRLGGVL